MTAVPKKVATRFTKSVGVFQKVLARAKDQDINESDTVTIITDMLAEVFGYDKYTEITSEFAIKNTYCDLAIKVDGGVQFLIEVKAIGLALKEQHLRQALNYGANHGIVWVVLTNGVDWMIYKIRFGAPIGHDLICQFNVLELNPRQSQDQEKLFLLCKEGISKAAIEDYHAHIQSVNRFVIGAIMLSEDVLKVVRRELRRMSPDLTVSIDEIEKILPDVLKRDVIEGDSAKDAMKRVKKSAGKALRKKRASKPASAQPDKEL
jgi:predicted type IV restriction endonuclease